MDASVDVVAMTGMGSGDAVGLGCFDAAGKNGYWLLVDPGNRSGAFVRDVNDKAQDPPLATWNTPAAQVGDIRSLRLSSHITSPVGSDVKLSAWINGVQVATTATTGGFAGCEGMMLIVVAQEQGAEVRFDNASAVVPGS